MAVVPVAPARAQDATCIDVTVARTGTSVSAPYPCGCGPAVSSRLIPGGVVLTINLGCPRL